MTSDQSARMQSETDQLTSTLRCAEFLSDSPSTSSLTNQPCLIRVKAQPRLSRVLQQSRPSTSQHVLKPIQRKRPMIDLRLNNAQHISIRTPAVDRGIHYNPRVLKNLLRTESWCTSNSHYFTAVQTEITEEHREQAIDWILDVSREERCDPDVFPFAVALIDRFLSVQNIFQKDIQCLAGTCLFIASKMKAPRPIHAGKINYYTADSVTVSRILSWELLILSQLGWDLAMPTAMDFHDHMAAAYPGVAVLRNEFVAAMHKMQKSFKLALMVPSLQACLSLLYVTSKQPCQTLLSSAIHCISELYQYDIDMLASYLPCIDNPALLVHPRTPVVPPSSSDEEAAVISQDIQNILVALSSSIPATPLNDSGFCSSAESPEQRFKDSFESDCSPPKLRRYSME